MNVSFTRNAARSDKDRYTSHTSQQECVVTLHLCTFGAVARDEAPKKHPGKHSNATVVRLEQA
jgi:hypothetical protein